MTDQDVTLPVWLVEGAALVRGLAERTAPPAEVRTRLEARWRGRGTR